MLNNNQSNLFGNKPPQQAATPFGAPPAQQSVNQIFGGQQQQTTPFGQQQSNIFGAQPIIGQNQPLFGQQQTQQPQIFGQTPALGQQTPFGQPAPLLQFPAQQNPNLFQTQQPQGLNLFPQQQQPNMGGMYPMNPYSQQYNQMQNAVNDANIFKDKFNNLITKLTDIEKEKSAFNQPTQQQQWQQMIQPLGQSVFSIDSKTVLDTSQQILAGQKEVAKKLDEYISTVGLVQKITEDGLEALKKEEAAINDYQKAQQTMKESYDSLSGNLRINQQFSVPQKYQEQLIVQQKEHYDSLTNTVEKMIKYYERQPNMEVDEALQYKLMHLQTISSYLYMLSLKIRNISERTTAFQTKVYPQIMSDKRIDEFYTIDTHKEMLDQIITEDI